MMQKFTMKLWSTAATLAAAAVLAAPAAAQETPAVSTAQAFPAGFDKAVAVMLAGEGGEGGQGMYPVWPTVSVPALNGSQIPKALIGNSLTMAYHHTLQFAGDGSVGGYAIEKSAKAPIAGTWRVDNHRLCLDARWTGNALNRCFHVFFMLDSVALVEDGGKIWHKGHKLVKGAAPDR